MGCRYCTISHGFDKVFDDEQIQDLSKEELLKIMDKGSCGMGSKVMIVFIKWSKKTFAIEVRKKEKKDDANADDL